MTYWRLTLASVLAVAFGIVAVGVPHAKDLRSEEPGKAADGLLGYAVMDGSNSVAVLDLASGTVLDRFSVEGNPHGGAITPDGRFIYTASMGSEKIYVLDARSGTTVGTFNLGSISHHVAVSADGRFAYVAADQVVVIDTSRNEIVARIATEDPPFDLAFTPDGRVLYALGMGSSIAVIDPSRKQVIDTIRMPARSVMGHLAFRPDGKELYATNDIDDMLSIIDAERGGTTLSVFDTRIREIVTTREVGERPEHVAGTPDGKVLLVSVNTGSNRILMIDPGSFKTLAEIDVWSAPHTLFASETARLQGAGGLPARIETDTAEDPTGSAR
jgi:DNA-binding beta-propeller fold protein YncE